MYHDFFSIYFGEKNAKWRNFLSYGDRFSDLLWKITGKFLMLFGIKL